MFCEIIRMMNKDSLAIRDSSRGLVVVNNQLDPFSQVDINADEIILQNERFRPMRATNVDLTLDISTAGINGLDAGNEQAYTWYYIWIIANSGGNIAGLMSLSSNDPILPASYTYKAFVGAVHNCRNAGNDFGPIKQIGNKVARNAVAVVNGGVDSAITPVDCSGAVPEKAVSVVGDLSLNIATGGGRGACWVRSAPDHGAVEFAAYLNAQGRLTVPFCIPVINSQTIYYNRDATSKADSITISICGFEY